jgi:hypothetical protein
MTLVNGICLTTVLSALLIAFRNAGRPRQQMMPLRVECVSRRQHRR